MACDGFWATFLTAATVLILVLYVMFPIPMYHFFHFFFWKKKPKNNVSVSSSFITGLAPAKTGPLMNPNVNVTMTAQ